MSSARVTGVTFDADESAAQPLGNNACGTGANERVEDEVAGP